VLQNKRDLFVADYFDIADILRLLGEVKEVRDCVLQRREIRMIDFD
jgi:hypothetical protein